MTYRMHRTWLITTGALWLLSGCESAEDDSGALTDARTVIATDDASLLDGASSDVDGSGPHSDAAQAGNDAAAADAGREGAAADAGAASDASSSDSGNDPYEGLRQVCVDTINQYRATLNLPPLARATAAQETCSDKGAKSDGDSMMAHGSAGSCSGLGAQNTCPGYKFGPGTGNATLEAALKRCLEQMWDEGMPPVTVKACIADPSCFPKYGHWINMSSSSSRVVACGFHDMGKNTFWMNQDFGR